MFIGLINFGRSIATKGIIIIIIFKIGKQIDVNINVDVYDNSSSFYFFIFFIYIFLNSFLVCRSQSQLLYSNQG